MDPLDPDIDDDERVLGRVLIVRIADENGVMRDDVHFDDGQGNEIDIFTAVGMLSAAQHALLCDHTNRTESQED